MMRYTHDNKVEFCRCGRCVSAGVGKEAVVCRGLRDHFYRDGNKNMTFYKCELCGVERFITESRLKAVKYICGKRVCYKCFRYGKLPRRKTVIRRIRCSKCDNVAMVCIGLARKRLCRKCFNAEIQAV